MEETLLITKRYNSNVYGAIAALVVFILMDCLFIALLFFQDAGWKGELFFIGGGLMFIFMTVKNFKEIFYQYGVYEIYEDRIIIHSIRGKLIDSVMRNRISSWSEFTIPKRRDSNYILTLYTPEKNIVIRSEYIGKETYNKIKYLLTNELTRNVREEIKRGIRNAMRNRNVSIGMILLLTIVFLKTYYSDSDIALLKPSTINRKISRPSKLEYNKGYLDMYLIPSPDSLVIDGESFAAFNSANFMTDVHPGDSIQIDEIRTEPIGFLEKILGGPHLYITGIRSHGLSYLNYDDYIYARKHSNQYLPYFIAIIFSFFFYFIYLNMKAIHANANKLESPDII